MSSRSVLGLVYILDGLRQQGVAVEAVLERYGMALDQLSPEAEIDRTLELRIITDLATVIDEPLVALRAGASISMAGYGALSMLLLTCDNACEAFQAGVRYQQLTYLFGEVSLELGEKRSALVISQPPLPPQARRFRIDGEAAGTWQLIKELQTNLGLQLRAESVALPYPKPPQAAAYAEFFECPVEFGAEATRFFMLNEYLNLPFPTANRTANKMYRAQCDQLLAQRREQSDDLVGRVRGYLELFDGGYPDAREVASVFGLSERSLRRQLSEQGSAFRKLLDGVRHRRACSLLRDTSMSTEAIAGHLGYADSAAFIHAFQRWREMSPVAFRKASSK